MPWRQGIRSHLMRRFRHAVGFDKRYSEHLFNVMDKPRRKWGAATSNETQRIRLRWLLPRSRQEKLMHGWNTRIPSHFMFGHGAPESERVEFRGHNDCAARK